MSEITRKQLETIDGAIADVFIAPPLMIFNLTKTNRFGHSLGCFSSFSGLFCDALDYSPDVPIKEEEYSLWLDGHVPHQPPLHGQFIKNF